MASSVRVMIDRARGSSTSPGGGALHMAAVALEQSDAQIALQTGDLTAERGLGRVHELRSPAETAVLSHGDERLEEIEFHLYRMVIAGAANEKLQQ